MRYGVPKLTVVADGNRITSISFCHLVFVNCGKQNILLQKSDKSWNYISEFTEYFIVIWTFRPLWVQPLKSPRPRSTTSWSVHCSDRLGTTYMTTRLGPSLTWFWNWWPLNTTRCATWSAPCSQPVRYWSCWWSTRRTMCSVWLAAPTDRWRFWSNCSCWLFKSCFRTKPRSTLWTTSAFLYCGSFWRAAIRLWFKCQRRKKFMTLSIGESVLQWFWFYFIFFPLFASSKSFTGGYFGRQKFQFFQ